MAQALLNIVSVLNILFILIVIFFDKRKPESTLAWVLVLFFIPYFGIVLYIVFGELFRFNIRRKERSKILKDKLLHEIINKQVAYIENDSELRNSYKWADLVLMNSKNAGSIVSFDNDIKVFSNARDKYECLFSDIRKAKESINISYYNILVNYKLKKKKRFLFSNAR